jgi:murein DD-endopeptidase MepM/ murein hydrolase activator NlpD
MLNIKETILKNQSLFSKVVPFNPTLESIVQMDFSLENRQLTKELISDTEQFSQYVNSELQKHNTLFGIGGYLEQRSLYQRSEIFGNNFSQHSKNINLQIEEPRTLHLGIDIWGNAGTPVFAPLNGIVHSFAFNDNFGDYGATIILQHQLEDCIFHTLYGHLSIADLQNLNKGMAIEKGQLIAHFGQPHENGNWPPHLHFQIIIDMQMKEGDYPGVCKLSEQHYYAQNCPDPDIILQMMHFEK